MNLQRHQDHLPPLAWSPTACISVAQACHLGMVCIRHQLLVMRTASSNIVIMVPHQYAESTHARLHMSGPTILHLCSPPPCHHQALQALIHKHHQQTLSQRLSEEATHVQRLSRHTPGVDRTAAMLASKLSAADQQIMRGCKGLMTHLPPLLSMVDRASCGGTARQASQMKLRCLLRDAMQLQLSLGWVLIVFRTP